MNRFPFGYAIVAAVVATLPAGAQYLPDPINAKTEETYLIDSLPAAKDRPANWPASVNYPRGLLPFKRAQYAQSIATTNNAPSISIVHRSQIKPKWQVSGGMEGISKTLWTSTVFKLVPPGWLDEWKTRLPVVNSFGYTQHEIGYTRAYPDGTLFVDMLSNAKTGKVFEHRVAQKVDGKWRRYVAFKDEGERPAGYAGLKGITCTTCHNRTDGPGTGGYAVGLVPGADTVVSDPFPRVEVTNLSIWSR